MTSKYRTALRAGLPLILAVASAPAVAADASTDVQRQLLQREQQQMELRLKMQQQLDRSTRLPQTPSADLQLRQLDRDQHRNPERRTQPDSLLTIRLHTRHLSRSQNA